MKLKNKHFCQAMAISYIIPKRKNKAKAVHAWAEAMRKGLK